MDNLKSYENPVVKIYDDYIQTNKLVDDVQKYLDDNYDSIKDKLATYTYLFEKNNGKINLVNFSVK